MCDQCNTEAYAYGGYLVPDYRLMRARKDGMRWQAGQLGIVDMNDPSFVFTVEPVLDPDDGLTEEQIDLEHEKDPDRRTKKYNNFFDTAREIGKNIRESGSSLNEIYRFMEACKHVGFEPNNHNFETWLCHFMAKWIFDHDQDDLL